MFSRKGMKDKTEVYRVENLSKEERVLLYRLVTNGVETTLAELEDDYLEQDVLSKYELTQCFTGLEKKGLILGTEREAENWYVDMWGMLNLRKPELTQAGNDYFIREQQLSCVEYYAPGEGKAVVTSYEEAAIPRAGASVRELQDLIAEKSLDGGSELNELLLELQEMIENMEQTKQIVKNSGFARRLEKSRENNNWFYNDVLVLLGRTVLKIARGANI